MMTVYSNNPYNNYVAPHTREYQALNDSAMVKWKPEKKFDLTSKDADEFTRQLESTAKTFGYFGQMKAVAKTLRSPSPRKLTLL